MILVVTMMEDQPNNYFIKTLIADTENGPTLANTNDFGGKL